MMYNHNILNIIILKVVKIDIYQVYKLALLTKITNRMVKKMMRHRRYLLYKKMKIVKKREPMNLFLAVKNGYADMVERMERSIDLEKSITPIFFGWRRIGSEALRYSIIGNQERYINRYEERYPLNVVEKFSASLVSKNQNLIDKYYGMLGVNFAMGYIDLEIFSDCVKYLSVDETKMYMEKYLFQIYSNNIQWRRILSNNYVPNENQIRVVGFIFEHYGDEIRIDDYSYWIIHIMKTDKDGRIVRLILKRVEKFLQDNDLYILYRRCITSMICESNFLDLFDYVFEKFLECGVSAQIMIDRDLCIFLEMSTVKHKNLRIANILYSKLSDKRIFYTYLFDNELWKIKNKIDNKMNYLNIRIHVLGTRIHYIEGIIERLN